MGHESGKISSKKRRQHHDSCYLVAKNPRPIFQQHFYIKKSEKNGFQVLISQFFVYLCGIEKPTTQKR